MRPPFTQRGILTAILAILSLYLTAGAWAEGSNVPTRKIRDRASKVMDSLLPGPPEMPRSTDIPDDRRSQDYGRDCRTMSRVEKGIVSVVGGVWQLATFWYPEDRDGASSPK